MKPNVNGRAAADFRAKDPGEAAVYGTSDDGVIIRK